MKLVPVILSGDAGARLWPVSREATPKPFMRIGERSLLQSTWERAAAIPGVTDAAVVTNVAYSYKVAEELMDSRGAEAITMLLEPFGRGTAPAVALAALWARERFGDDAVLLVLPADHAIERPDEFFAATRTAARLARETGHLMLFGVTPSRPDTSLGYIEWGSSIGDTRAHHVLRFIEKPPAEQATGYVLAGNFAWNSGMSCFTVHAIVDALAACAPEVLRAAEAVWRASPRKGTQLAFDATAFAALPDISFDYAVLERSSNVAVIPCGFGWSDVGSWAAVSEANAHAPDAAGNVVDGDAIFVKSKRTYVRSEDRLIAAVGVEDLVVVDTPDALLVAHKNASQDVREVVRALREKGADAYKHHRTMRYPWGADTVLHEATGVRIKRLEIKPGAALAFRTHRDRSEHWVVADGLARMTIGDSTFESGPNESRYVPMGTRHRLHNPGRTPLVVVEVQCGDFGGTAADDDVERLDDLGRQASKLPLAVAGPAGARPLRVLHVYKTFFPDSVGGLEQAIAQMVTSTRRHGVEARVVSLSRNPVPHRRHFRATEHFRYRETLSLASNSVSLGLAADFGRHVDWADVIHYHFPWPFADLLHLMWRVRKPSLVTYHSDIVRQRRLMTIYRPLMDRFLGSVDRIVATSPNYVQTSDVLRRYTDKTSVIPIGLEPAGYPATRAETLARWRNVLGEKFFLFIGVIRYYKGLHILLDAVTGTKLPTVIVGAGPIEAELRRHAQEKKLDHVKFLGMLPEEDKVALLELCAAVVFPSHLRSEAFGVTLLEGAMFGKPMISSEIGTGTSYINVNGETGLVVPPGDPVALRAAMERLDADPSLRERMGRAARRRFEERFTAERMGTMYVGEYRDLVEKAAFEGVRLRHPA
ncbi:MAG TPA: mannose-1-phosphate guanylyltransferase/mannose-6-phosphate isomerase [Burkholderiaceae bacterium]|nr:mannose-1-phosphate guanylyltransferase/mannose-6-phosphate isomerase [Burkholderiaceae bacterium]